MQIGKHEHIVTAFAEPASGPGWSNSPVWVIIKSTEDGTLRMDCLQPAEQTSDIAIMYSISSIAHASMVKFVRAALSKGKKS